MELNYKNLLPFESPIAELYKKIEELQKMAKSGKIDLEEETKMILKRVDVTRREIFANLTPLQIVQIARHLQRPTTLDYVGQIVDGFEELHGDRNYSDDPAMVCGIGKIDNLSCIILGHQKGKNTKENIARNFGMAQPEGYRKALRIMRLGDRFGKPIITLIDTPGAYPGIGAEERGQAEAIAKNLRAMAELHVPFIAVITGEGGSGGALGIGMGNRVLMLEYSIYSVISPEGCASILWRDATKANLAAAAMKITSKDLLELGVIDEIIKEPLGGAHQDIKLTAQNVKKAVLANLKPLLSMSSRELIADRYNKFRKMGIFTEE
jgi:acetyl-CoA carboxylase carboxyl transferase subunit alpha